MTNKSDNKRKTKIFLVQICNRNYGDAVITDNTKFLIKKSLPFYKKESYDILDYNILLNDTEQIKYADAVIFAGGGIIKCRNEMFDKYIVDILKETDKYGIPTFFNAVGVEGFDPSDERCLALKDALNSDCIKGITVRDDIGTLTSHYITNKNIRLKSVVDSAVWSDKVYGRLTDRKSEYIGLGIARDKLFTDYGIEKADREFLLDFWKGVAERLESEGFKWIIFTNGLNSDEAFADEVLRYIGHGEKAAQPQNAEELIALIRNLKGMIACRMHANIIAYSFRIPSVGLIWNDKLKYWGEKIGYPERYLDGNSLDPEDTVNALKTALSQGCSRRKTNRIKYKTYREIKRFIKKVKPLNNVPAVKIDFSKRMSATALGGIDFKYKNTNTLDALRASVDAGYEIFETDIRLTKDGKLVCVNGWSKDTFNKLGLEHTSLSSQGLDYDDFLNQKYYKFFNAVSFESLLKELSVTFKDKSFTMILDIGLPKKDLLSGMLDDMIVSLKKFNHNPDNFIFRLQRQNDVKIYKEKKYPAKIAYFMPAVKGPDIEPKEHYKKVISFCKTQKINLITMSNDVYNEQIQTLLDESRIEAFVMTYSKAGDIIEAISNGVHIAGSHYYGPDYINRLTN